MWRRRPEGEPDSSGSYVSISVDPDADVSVADLVYRGEQWASLNWDNGDLVLTVYGKEHVPLGAALAALKEAEDRLRRFGP